MVGKHYQRERERLSKLISKRWRLQRTLVELELTARLRRNAAAAEESRKLAAEIAPLEEEKRQLELIIHLQNRRQAAVLAERENQISKFMVAEVVRLQRPDLGNLVKLIGLE